MHAIRLFGVIGAICAYASAVSASGTGDESIVLCAGWGDRHPETASMAVSYEDLDLRLPEARKALNARIEAAAHQLCWRVVETRFLADQISCRGQAIYDVRDQVRRAEWRAESAPQVMPMERVVSENK
jgi:UrcA family protein